VLERQQVGLEQTAGRGRQAQRQHCRVLIGQVAWDRRCQVGEHDGVGLEGALRALLVHPHRMIQDPVAYLEPRDGAADLNDLAGQI